MVSHIITKYLGLACIKIVPIAALNSNQCILTHCLTCVIQTTKHISLVLLSYVICMFQMYSMVWCVGLPSKIGDLETLILLTSCICHDLDHPGYNNIYQVHPGS